MNEHRHISAQFEAELQTLQGKFAAMGGLIEEQVRSAMSAFKTIDLSLAQSVRERETQVNQFEMEIDQETTTILARRQPTASDLRLLVGLLKSSTDLERIGDEADRIAKVTINTEPASPPLEDLMAIREDVATLESLASQMLRESLNQFARKDESGATATIAADAEVDKVYNTVIDSCSEGMTRNPTHVDEYMAVIWVARSLERIGDHAKNIAENTVYSVRGTDVRHPNIPE
ncbi:MAG: phosphate signaling complex protein PhoU [Gammaproteobacteria bacterium]|nr:phosphate signaling complex protein PhoU [Gammaproteobacteria bacterium]